MILMKLMRVMAWVQTEKNRITSFLLALLMTVSMLPSAAFAAEEECSCPPDHTGAHVATCPLYVCDKCGTGPWHETCPESEEPSGGEGGESTSCDTCGEIPCVCEPQNPDGDNGGTVGPTCEICGSTEPCDCATVPPAEDDGSEDSGEEAPVVCERCGENPCTCPAYVFSVGKRAEFNHDNGFNFFNISADKPTADNDSSWDSLSLDGTEDAVFLIEDYTVVSQAYEQTVLESLWYQVTLLKGTAPEGYADGIWIFQNYLNDDPSLDTLTIREPEQCDICGKYDCTTEHVRCDICGEYDCEIEHVLCDICGGYDCHHTYCGVCGEMDCEIEHIYCPICRNFDCELEHEYEPEVEPYIPPTEPVIPENPVLPEEYEVAILDEAGNPISVEDGITLDWKYKTSLSAWSDEEGMVYYQWQICYDAEEDLWVDISGQNGQGLLVSHTMLRSVMDDDNGAWLRCLVESEVNELYSDPVRVTVDDTGYDAGSAEPEAPEEEEVGPVMLFLRRVMAAPAALFNSLVNPAADEPDNTEYVTITINYWDANSFITGEEKRTVTSAYKASIPKGTAGDSTVVFPLRTVTSPRITGYAPFWETDDDDMIWTGDDYYTREGKYEDPTGSEPADYSESAAEIALEFTGDQLQEDIVIDVYYLPVKVNVAFRYYFQNLYNDSYTEDISLYHTRKVRTGTVIKNEELVNYAGDTTGFTRVYHPDTAVAADGSTVFLCYYDRNYYLSNFYLDGGHGVTPIYARYGTPLNIGTPVKNGYKFLGWDLIHTDYIDDNGVYQETNDEDGVSDAKDALPAAVDTVNRDYKALWQPDGTVPYTVVYWRENADPESDGTYKYSVWGSATRYAPVETLVNGTDDVPTAVTNPTGDLDEKKYFTFNASLTDKNVPITNDGSTFVNVYYTRNSYTIRFTGYGTCALPVHTHGTGCNSTLICPLEEHTHSAACGTQTVSCGMLEHTAHTDACLQCTHTHTLDCYRSNNRTLRQTTKPNQIDEDEYVDGQIYTYVERGWLGGTTTYYYLYLNGNWYCGRNNNNTADRPDNPISLTCSHTTHSAACYKDILHTHVEACYTYSNCNKTTHTHSDSCYSACTIIAGHTHTTTGNNNRCDQIRNGNVVYVLTAKYDADISAVWPTYELLGTSDQSKHYRYTQSNGTLMVVNSQNGNNRFSGWSVDGVTNTATSKRINMTTDLCDTTDNVKNASANYQGSNVVHLYYMFESFNQEETETSDTRKKYNNKWYDSAPGYYQVVIANSTSFGQKEIMGMSAVGTGTPVSRTDENGNTYHVNWLYYDRNGGLQIKFQNRGETAHTIDDLKYGEPMEGYVFDAEGKLYEPPYPSTLEPNAYEFKGWYTTSNYIPGTEADEDYFRSNKAVMPNHSVDIYAKWEKVSRNVNFFFHYEYLEAYEADEKATFIEYGDEKIYFRDDGTNVGNGGMKSFTVTHGETLDDIVLNPEYQLPIPDNAKVFFVNWFYIQDGQKHAYSPGEIPVRQDLNVYAEWRTELTEPYRISYVLNGTDTKIAEDSFGYATVGTNLTFQAKVGAPRNEMLDGYNKGYFPLAASHTISIRMEEGTEPEYNTYSFKYVKATDLKYTVRYVTEEDGREIELGSEEVETENSFVTVRYKEFDGYVADAFYKELVLAVIEDPNNKEQYISSPTNVITFYYTKSEDAQYMVHHMVEKLHDSEVYADTTGAKLAAERAKYYINGTGGYENYGQSTQLQVKDNETVTISPLTNIPGFVPTKTSKVVTVNKNGDPQETVKSASSDGNFSVTIAQNGTEIYIFYERQKFAYSVEYLDFDTHVRLGSGTGGEAFYGSKVSTPAPQYILDKSYELVSESPQSIQIREDAAQNVITFYYSPIEYQVDYVVVGGVGGSFTPSNKEVFAGTKDFEGTKPIANTNYEFVGWYLDPECTVPVTDTEATINSTTYHLKPKKLTDKTTGDPITKYTFYAKFELLAGDFTIFRERATPGQVFVYRIKDAATNGEKLNIEVSIQAGADGNGSKTIKNLPYGEYIVEQLNSWSWRYTRDTLIKNVTHSPETNSVFYGGGVGVVKWLSGIGDFIRRIFGGI